MDKVQPAGAGLVGKLGAAGAWGAEESRGALKLDGLRIAPLLQVLVAVACPGAPCLEFLKLRHHFFGLGGIPFLHQGRGERVVDRNVDRVPRQGLAQVLDGRLPIVLGGVQSPGEVECRRILRVQREHRFHLRQRLFVAAGRAVQQAEHIVGLSLPRVLRDDVFQDALGLVVLPVVKKRHSEVHVSGGQVRGLRPGLLKMGGCLREVELLHLGDAEIVETQDCLRRRGCGRLRRRFGRGPLRRWGRGRSGAGPGQVKRQHDSRDRQQDRGDDAHRRAVICHRCCRVQSRLYFFTL